MNMPKITIQIVPSTKMIPDLLSLEQEIKEGDTYAYLSDSDGRLHKYTMDHGELIYSSYPEDIGVARLLELIEEEVVENEMSRDPNFYTT